jgi:CRP-like cAMP-binding protein
MAAGDERPVGIERLLFLRSLSMGAGEGPEVLQVAGAMREVFFERAQEIFAIGDPAGDIFFLVRGSVRMTAPGAPPWDFDAPAIVGVFDAFAGRPRSRRAVATSDLHALSLAYADWLAVLEENHELACEAVLRVAAMLRRTRLGIAGDGGHDPPAPAGPAAAGLGSFARTRALRRLPILRDASVEVTLRLAELAQEIDLAPGEVLFREGDPGETLSAVASGLVAVERADPPLRAVFGPGALVGGAAAVGLGPHPFTARAELPTVVLRLHRDDVLDLMEDHFDLTRGLLSAIGAEREELMRRYGTD